MIYFSQTSLIPSVIALSKFFAENFPNFWWYPNWYLGNPFYFLIGPVVPSLLFITSKVGFLPYDAAYIAILILSQLLGAIGLYMLARECSASKHVSLVSALFFLSIPLAIVLLSVANGLDHAAFGFLPVFLLVYLRWVNSSSLKKSLALSFFLSFLVLIDVSILLPAIIGVIALLICIKTIKLQLEYVVFKTIVVFLLGIIIATFWYTPSFWFTLIVNPSFGGVPLGKLTKNLIDLFLHIAPLVIAVVVVRWRDMRPQPFLMFGILFFASFFVLSVVRFLSDPDFVIDWIGFFLELQLGLSIVGAFLLSKLKKARLVFYTIIIVFFLIADFFAINLGFRSDEEYYKKLTRWIEAVVLPEERIFLSGSAVFWINGKTSVLQVRGVGDNRAIHPYWAHAAYQIREGKSSELTYNWLTALGSSYVLVHKKDSDEYFKDFKHPDKFASFPAIAEDQKDVFYSIERSSIVRIADKKILSVQKPVNGADKRTLNAYVGFLGNPVTVVANFPTGTTVTVNLQSGEVLWFAQTFTYGWKVDKNTGLLRSDQLGNMIFIPEKTGQQKITFLYTKNNQDTVFTFIALLITLILLVKFNMLYNFFVRRFPSMSFGLDEEE